MVALSTMNDEQIMDLVARKVTTEEELNKRFKKPMEEFMKKIEAEMEACKAAESKAP